MLFKEAGSSQVFFLKIYLYLFNFIFLLKICIFIYVGA